jgi:hypothetical protein
MPLRGGLAVAASIETAAGYPPHCVARNWGDPAPLELRVPRRLCKKPHSSSRRERAGWRVIAAEHIHVPSPERRAGIDDALRSN